MRKWLFFAIGATIISCVGGYWYFSNPATDAISDKGDRPGFTSLTKQANSDNGNAEESDVIEPLIVDHGTTNVPPVNFTGPLAHPNNKDGGFYIGGFGRGTWTPMTIIPPRPDGPRRMPYADEEPAVAPVFDPISWIMESKLPNLKLFDDPTEESEPRESSPPVWHPHAYPHCPYTGGCPIPSHYPLIPRD